MDDMRIMLLYMLMNKKWQKESECDQEIPQSHTTDQAMATWGRVKQWTYCNRITTLEQTSAEASECMRGWVLKYTLKPVWSGHSKIDKTKVLIANGSLMKVESIAECILQYFWPAWSDDKLNTNFWVTT